MSEIIKHNNDKDRIIEKPFKARARLLPQLGDMLIKSEDVAFLELIKNSYDADADEVKVLMEKITSPKEGIIIIEDNGVGMDLDLILNVWLELASDFKTKQVKDSLPTLKGRLPIGEKGIGRLGVHKLGNKIELITKKLNSKEVHVNIDWREFEKGGYLEDVPVKVIEKHTPEHFLNGNKGTYIAITDFQEKTKWTRGKFRDILRTVTSFTSPFEETNESFKPTIEILDNPEWKEDIITWEDVKDYSIIQFEIEISGEEITKFHYKYEPYSVFEKAKERTIKYGEFKDENGNLKFFDDKLVSANKTVLEDTKKAEPIDVSGLGTIKFKGYIFNLEAFVIKDTVSDKKGLKSYLSESSGVKVYRGTEPNENNEASFVRVYNYGEPGNDWLGLNLKRVNFSSSISNNLIVGGVFLDRESTKELQEKTDRQGFIEDENYKNFRDAINHSVSVIDIFRRADVKALRDLYGPKGGEEPVISSINKLRTLVNEKIKSDKPLNIALNKYINDIESSYNTIQSQLIKTASAGLSLGIVLHEIEKVIGELLHIIKNEDSNNVAELIKRLNKLVKGYAEIFKKSNRNNIDVKDVIEDALFSVEFRLRAHEVEVIKEYEKSKANINLAKGLIEGVLINLIDNSIYWLEIAKKEHKTISQKKIFINIEETEKNIHLIIADNGTGFLLSKDEIIQPFVTGKKSGMGLGLHIANEIMLSHKGKLDFPDFRDYTVPEEFKKGAIISLIFPK
ncbi:histidine kinase [Tenacibaculum adriaticum]|uniref:histidine kinase n=1 Tax=Tenacibaculum adriaticum TaxID=413713 RepID=A0A5S5DNG7_9FLAO|nr:sensor histidine kinase [Tenacibaculum adriaticum]TYP97457.1 histidine kinase [Tenacibaculum adriaticum]